MMIWYVRTSLPSLSLTEYRALLFVLLRTHLHICVERKRQRKKGLGRDRVDSFTWSKHPFVANNTSKTEASFPSLRVNKNIGMLAMKASRSPSLSLYIKSFLALISHYGYFELPAISSNKILSVGPGVLLVPL